MHVCNYAIVTPAASSAAGHSQSFQCYWEWPVYIGRGYMHNCTYVYILRVFALMWYYTETPEQIQ